MASLRALPDGLDLGCYRVYVRVDWNIPLNNGLGVEASLKLTRSLPLLQQLHEQGAITFVLTHLGRPKGRDKKLSTKPLASVVAAHLGLPVRYLDVDLSSPAGRERFAKDVDRFEPGDVVLLENVRFQPGEETADKALIQEYASHADLFINNAFASCHRAHVSVTGLAKAMPSFAGPALVEEVGALTPLLKSPRRPYAAIIGGAKLSTKLPVIKTLLKKADKVMVGGAMAHAFFKAKNIPIGKSYIEEEGVKLAKKVRDKKLLVPEDVVVAKKVAIGQKPVARGLKEVGASESIVDIGPRTMQNWSEIIRTAKTIVWNGPVGVTEIPAFAHGSLVIGSAIASHAKSKAYGVAGGGDTIPVVARTGTQEWFDFVSTGGGAMLEFLAEDGKLPGLKALQGTQSLKVPPRHAHNLEQGMSCAPDLPTAKKKKS